MKIKIILLSISIFLFRSFSNCQVDGSLDLSFEPLSGANAPVHALAIQNDGKIVIGGGFSSYDGIPSYSITRVNSDGTLDTSFDSGEGILWGMNINSIALQQDGKIIIGGTFTNYNYNYSEKVARLLPDGTFDPTFNATSGILGDVHVVTIQADGKILVGGNFSKYGGVTRKNIVRINPDGTLDTGFSVGTGANSGTSASNVNDIKIQSDGKILVVGNFLNYNGTVCNHITRLNEDGSVDTSFNPGTGANSAISSISIQNNGKYVIGGHFNQFNSTGSSRVAILNNNGSLDNSFNSIINYVQTIYVSRVMVQEDGKILVSGWNYFNRLNTDGSEDLTYNSGVIGVNERVNSFDFQPDGKPIIVGWFTAYNSVTRNRIARLNGPQVNGTEEHLATEVSIFPNPSNGKINLNFYDEMVDQPTIHLMSQEGKMVFNSVLNKNSTELDFSFLPKGIYFYSIITNDQLISTGKLIFN